MSATDWTVISERDLNFGSARSTNRWFRTYCHIHGSDNQRSLSINEETGFGQCHSCKVQVLVREWNGEAAENIERVQSRLSDGVVKVVDPRAIAHAARSSKGRQKSPSVKPWQREEVSLLRSLQDSMESRLSDERAASYFAQRGVRVETAQALGVGYIPNIPLKGKYACIARWADHIVFPMTTPDGVIHYAGRSLRLWIPGMDEDEHKAILEAKEKELRGQARVAYDRGDETRGEAYEQEANLYLRWYKTHSNGWFNFQALQGFDYAVFCEGGFDALALLEAGITNTVAIIGTSLSVDWVPTDLKYVYLALDSDKSGVEKSEILRNALYERGFDVTVCLASSDDLGKDWSERYRRAGKEGLISVLDPLPLCCDCLDENCETLARGEYDGIMYCSKHLQKLQSVQEVEVSHE